jgi:hypothetical protein
MKELFQMSDLGLLSYYLDIEVKQDADGIQLCQSVYVSKILERCGLSSCNPCASPMENQLKLSKKSSASVIDATKYRSLIRALRYLLHTQPDLSFSVGYHSHFMEDPRSDHLASIKRVLQYVAATRGYYRYPAGQVPLRTSFKSRQCLRCAPTSRHVSCSTGPYLSVKVSSEAATCPVAPDPTS